MSRSSPRASLNSPSASSSGHGPSASPSTKSRSSNAPTATPRGPVPLALETSYHKRLRSLLLEHRKLRKEWNELVLRGILGRCKSVVEAWIEVENCLRAVQAGVGISSKAQGKQRESSSSIQLQKSQISTGYLYAQSLKLSDSLELIATILGALEDILSTMNSIVERAEGLVVEGSKTRGTAFAFREPLWVTWPLSRFADGIAELTACYGPSLVLIRSLVETLTTFPPLPETLPPLVSPLSSPSTPALPTDTPAVLSLEKVDVAVRPSNEVLQACMSLLAVQPLIPGKMNTASPEAWEELCALEVGGWGA